MSKRTDLAQEKYQKNKSFLLFENEKIKVFKTVKESEKSGEYLTLCFEDLENMADYFPLEKEIEKALYYFDINRENILVIALGNDEITSDNIGPKTAKKVLATRHIAGDFAHKIGLSGIRKVSVLVPNVLAKTGIETLEFVKAISEKINPSSVIVIDALCAATPDSLFKRIQITNTGISPGSGVKNKRKEISEKTLGIPVIAIGIPTVTDAESIVFEYTKKAIETPIDLILTPKDCDLYVEKITDILSRSLNRFLQPEIEEDVLFSLV